VPIGVASDAGDAPSRASAAARGVELDRPIFISGCNRGGTTIFSRLLSEHPEVNNIGTGPFHEGMHIWRRHFPDYSHHRWAVDPWRWRLQRKWANPRPRVSEDIRERFGELDDGRRLMDKTPSHAIRVELIDRLFPSAVFLHVLRDGRHTVCSLIARGVKLKYAVRQWIGAHETALASLERLDPSRVVIARYEELVARPGETLLAICRGLQLSQSEAIRARLEAAATEQLRVVEQRWDELPERQREFVLEQIAPLQERLGYG